MADECKTCPYESIIQELQNDSKRNSEQHREFYGKFSSQATAIALSEERYTNLLTVISEIKTSVDRMNTAIQDINNKPAKRWDNLITTIISCVATAIVVFILSKVGI